MKYKELVNYLKAFLASEYVCEHFDDIETYEPWPDCSPMISMINPDLPKSGFGHQSGIYFLCSPDDDIYYIGKATKNNLHEEVWGKIKTPTKLSSNKQTYEKNYFLGKKLEESAIKDVTRGNLKIGIVVISNPIVASLAEVYLQTIYVGRNGALPGLNARIG